MVLRLDTNEPKPNPSTGSRRGTGSGGKNAPSSSTTATPAFGTVDAPIDGVPHWDDDADAWDVLHLGGEEVPGICKVTVSKERALDIKKPKGKSGAVLTDDGYAGARGRIVWRLWTPEQWRLRKWILNVIDPKANEKEMQAWTVGHAVFADRRVSSICIKKIDGPDEDSDGCRVYTIDWVEFMPPPKKVATATVATESGAGGKTGRDPSSPRDPKAIAPSGYQYDENGNLYKGNKVVKLGDAAQATKDSFAE